MLCFVLYFLRVSHYVGWPAWTCRGLSASASGVLGWQMSAWHGRVSSGRPWTSKGAFQAAMAAPVRLLWRHLSVFAALHGWRHEEQLWIRKFTYLLTACSFDLSHHQEETARSNIWGSSFTDAWFLCFWLDIWHWWSSWYYSFGRRLNPTITHSFVLLRQKTTQTTQGKSSFYSTHNTYLFLNVCICFIPVALLIYSFLAAWS